MTPLLVLSHLAACAVGACVTWWIMVRYFRAREVEGHIILELNPYHPTGPHMPHRHHPDEHDDRTDDETGAAASSSRVAVVLILASLFVVAIGAQAFIAARDNAARDAETARENAARDAADREYADCLTEFADDLVATLQAVRKVNRDVLAAQVRKDAALDRVFELTRQAQASGATDNEEVDPAILKEYRAVVRERVAAQAAYDAALRKSRETQKENPYVSPKVVCDR